MAVNDAGSFDDQIDSKTNMNDVTTIMSTDVPRMPESTSGSLLPDDTSNYSSSSKSIFTTIFPTEVFDDFTTIFRWFYHDFSTIFRQFFNDFSTIFRRFYDDFSAIFRRFTTIFRPFFDEFSTILRRFLDDFTMILRRFFTKFVTK